MSLEYSSYEICTTAEQGKKYSITAGKFVSMPVRLIPYSFHRPKTFHHKILSASESSLPISLWLLAPSPVYWFNDPDTVCTLLIQPVVRPDSFWLCFASLKWMPTKICSAGARQTSSFAYCGIITKSPFRFGKFLFLQKALNQKHLYFLTNIVVYNERCYVVCNRNFLRVPSLDKGMTGETDGLGLLEYWFLLDMHDFSEFKWISVYQQLESKGARS
jgi:hypothetical protein